MTTSPLSRPVKITSAFVTGAVTAIIGVAVVLGSAVMARPSGVCSAGNTTQPNVAGEAAADIPADYLPLYQQTGYAYGVPWNILAAIGKNESDHGRYAGPGVRRGANYAGAAGPMQIGIGGAAGNAWSRLGVDGDGDGRKDVHNPHDAIPGAARILLDKGFKRRPREAVRRYNGSGPEAEAYADRVMALAARYGSGGSVPGPGGWAAGGLCGRLGASEFAAPSGPVRTGTWPREKIGGPDNLTPRTRRVRDLVKERFGVPKGIGCYRTGPDAQDHGEGRACDFMISSGSPSRSQISLGFAIANWATSNASQLGINYVIYRQRIWNIERATKGWRLMENRGSLTANHFDHVHISVF